MINMAWFNDKKYEQQAIEIDERKMWSPMDAHWRYPSNTDMPALFQLCGSV